MLKWIKSLFGGKTDEVKLPDESVTVTEVEKPVKKRTTKKSTPKKKAPTDDLSAMSKVSLLALAKEKGIKANASLKKSEIIDRIKNAK